MGSLRQIGGKNLLDEVRRHQRNVFLVKAFFVFSIAAFLALLNILLLLSSTSLPAILTVVLLDVTQVAFFLLALRSIPRYIRKVLLATDSFPGTPDLLRRIEEVVEEVSLAAGIIPPKLLFIKYEWEGAPIAFCFKEKRKAAIVINRPMWEDLSIRELRAIIAHEIAHVYVGDAGNNTLMMPFEFIMNYEKFRPEKMKAFGGFAWVILLTYALAIISPFYFLNQPDIGTSDLIIASLFVALFYPFAIILPGLMLTSFHSRTREYLADALAMKWTMDPEALIGAINKVAKMMKHNRLEILDNLMFVSMTSKKKKTGGIEDSIEVSVKERLDYLQNITSHVLSL